MATVQAVHAALEAIGGISREAAVPTARLENLGFDSLMLVELAVMLGRERGITIPDAVARKWDTVGEVVAFLDAEGR